MSCCSWSLPNYIKRFGDQISNWFSSKDIQNVSIVTNPMLAIDTKQYPPILIMQKLARINKTSTSREIINDLVYGKTSKYKLATYYTGNHFDIGLPIFYVKGTCETFNNKLKDELLLNSGTGETDRSLIQFVYYSDTPYPTNDTMAYHYMEHNGYNRTTQNRVDIQYVVEPTTLDVANEEYTIATGTITDTGNELDLGTITTFLIVDVVIYTKGTTPSSTFRKYLLIQLLDESTGDTYYHELREDVDSNNPVDRLNKIIVVYGVTGYDCCYYYEYQLGSNAIPELEDKDGETNDASYGIFTMLPIIPLKYNDTYVYDMKSTDYNRYLQTKKLCSKLGFTLKSLHNVITDKGTTPAEEAEAITSQNNTKDVFLEFSMNIDRSTKENMKSLYLTAKDYHTYTTTVTDIYEQATYTFNIKHDETTDSRYNKSIEIDKIHKEIVIGTYMTISGLSSRRAMKYREYVVEKYMLQVSDTLSVDGLNGITQYDIDDNPSYLTYSQLKYAPSILRCVYQDKESFIIYDMYNVTISSVIEDSGYHKGVSISVRETFQYQDLDSKSLSIPLTKEVLTQLSFVHQYDIYDQTINITYFASTITTLSWYERPSWVSFFQVVLYAISAVVIYFSASTASSISAWLMNIAFTIGTGYALKKALESTNNKFLQAIIVIVYLAVSLYNSTDSSTSSDEFMMLLASNAIKISDIFINTESESVRKEMMNVLNDLNEAQRELDKKVKNYDRDDREFNLDMFRLENTDELYNRVLNIDLVEQIDQMVEAVLSSEYTDYDMSLLPR